MRNIISFAIGFGVALAAIGTTPSPGSACSVSDLVVWNPYWDCGGGGPRYHRWPDWQIFSYSVHPAQANLDWIAPVVGGVAGMDGANDKATFVWSPSPAANVVLFDYDGSLWPWQPTQLANNTLSINLCGGYFSGNWTVRYNVFHNPDWASSCNDSTWDVGTTGVHEAGLVNGLGGHAAQSCSTSTVMAKPRTKTHCFFGPMSLDQEAVSLLYTAIPASDVLWFRVENGVATWSVEDQDGTVAWRVDGTDDPTEVPEPTWTEVVSVGPGARTASVSGFAYYRLMEVEEYVDTPKGYAPATAPSFTVPTLETLPSSVDQLNELLTSLHTARYEQELRENHPEKTRGGRKPWSEESPGGPETTGDYDDVIFTRSQFVGDAQQQVADYHAYWGFNSLVVDLDASGIADSNATTFRTNLQSAIATFYNDQGVTRFHLIGDASDYEEMYQDGVWQQYWVGEWATRRTTVINNSVPGGQPELNIIPTITVADTAGRNKGNYSYSAPYWFTDWLYGDVDGDRAPEATVVRWPVSNNAELLAAALKMQVYNDYGWTSGSYDMSLWVGDANYTSFQYDGRDTAAWADSVVQAVEAVAPGQTVYPLFESDHFGRDERMMAVLAEWNSRDPSVILQLSSNSWRYAPCNMLHKYYVDDWDRSFGMDMVAANNHPLVVAASCQAASCVQTESEPGLSLETTTPLCEDEVLAVNGPIAFVGPSMGTEQHSNYLICKKFMERIYDPANASVPLADLFRNALVELYQETDPSFERVRYDVALSYLFLGDALSPLLAPSVATGVRESPQNQSLHLGQNYPNPFNPSTRLPFYMPAPGRVRLTIYNVSGERVRVVIDEHRPAGNQEGVWDGRDNRGQTVGSGVYFVRIEAHGHTLSKKITLLK